MIVLDANLLLYASDPTSPNFSAARDWLETVLSGDELVGMPWQTIHAFLRIATNPNLKLGGATVQQAVGVVNQWLALRQVRVLVPGDHHWDLLQRMLIDGQARGTLTTDAQLAAIAIEHGGVLQTTDRDFARFPGLRWANPLLKSSST